MLDMLKLPSDIILLDMLDMSDIILLDMLKGRSAMMGLVSGGSWSGPRDRS